MVRRSRDLLLGDLESLQGNGEEYVTLPSRKGEVLAKRIAKQKTNVLLQL